MASFKFLSLALVCSTLFSSFEEQRIQFLIAKKEYKAAIEFYLKNVKETGKHDQEILRNLSKSFIESAIISSDSKEQMLGLYALMISQTNDQDYDFSKLLQSLDPYVQMLTIQYLSGWSEDFVEVWLNKAMSSPYLPVRLHALGVLVDQKSRLALSHIESLYYRLPEFFRPMFAQYYAALGTPQALKILRQMLSDPNSDMKVATILSICQFKRDDFIEDIRKILTQPDPKVQESAIFASCLLHDQKAQETVEGFVKSNYTNLKLAALIGLNEFQDLKNKQELLSMAENGDLFSIYSLGMIDGTEELLVKLSKHPDYNVRLNVLACLLEKKHPLAKALLIDFFQHHSLYDGITPNFSIGRTQNCLKMYPSYQKQFQKMKEFAHYVKGMTSMIRVQFLIQALELNEDDFLEIAEVIFQNDLFDLIPTLVRLLENCHSEKAIAMIKKMGQKVGSPRTRLYCLVALARLKDPEFTPQFFDWLSNQKSQDLIQLDAFDTEDVSAKKRSRFHLSPDEKSQLLIEAYETLIYLHDERCFSILLEALVNTPKQNQPVLAGILLKALL